MKTKLTKITFFLLLIAMMLMGLWQLANTRPAIAFVPCCNTQGEELCNPNSSWWDNPVPTWSWLDQQGNVEEFISQCECYWRKCDDGPCPPGPQPPNTPSISLVAYNNHPKIFWDPVSNADSYLVYRNNTLITTIPSTSYLDEDYSTSRVGSSNQINYYKVKAQNEAGSSGYSNIVSIVVWPLP